MWLWTISLLGIQLETAESWSAGWFVGIPIAGRWASPRSEGVCAWQGLPTAASATAGIVPVGEQDVGSAYSQQKASGPGWTWQRASPLVPGPGRAEKAGALKAWKWAWAEQARTPAKPKHTSSCLMLLRGSWWRQLPARNLCCIKQSVLPSRSSSWAKGASLDKKIELVHLAAVLQMPPSPAGMHSPFSRSATCALSFKITSKQRSSCSMFVFTCYNWLHIQI